MLRRYVASGGGEVNSENSPPEQSEVRLSNHAFKPLSSETVGASGPAPLTVTSSGYDISTEKDINLGGFVFKKGAPFLHNEGGSTFFNTALGLNALASVTPGIPTFGRGRADTALGDSALRANTEGYRNTALGTKTLRYNTTGFGNTAIGSYALYTNVDARLNTAVGDSALFSNESGRFNTAVGASALFYNTSGIYNTALGVNALEYNESGYQNTAIGNSALSYNDTGGDSTAVGRLALSDNTSGSGNTAVGSSAIGSNISGSGNTAVGFRAFFNSTGTKNTALGNRAGYNATTGNSNIFVGNEGLPTDTNLVRLGTVFDDMSDGDPSNDTGQNQTFIAGIHGQSTSNSNDMAVMISDDGKLGTMTSSRLFKEGIRDLGATSNRLLDLRPVSFRFKRESTKGQKPVQFGLIAEEVAEVFPELTVYDEEGEPYTVRYHLLPSLLLNELQKQHRRIQVQGWLLGVMLLVGIGFTVRRWQSG